MIRNGNRRQTFILKYSMNTIMSYFVHFIKKKNKLRQVSGDEYSSHRNFSFNSQSLLIAFSNIANIVMKRLFPYLSFFSIRHSIFAAFHPLSLHVCSYYRLKEKLFLYKIRKITDLLRYWPILHIYGGKAFLMDRLP